MAFRIDFYLKIEQLMPSLKNAVALADLLRSLLHELIIEGIEKDTLYFVSKREIVIREVLKDYYQRDLNPHQLILFNEIKSQVLDFLNSLN